MATRMRFVAGLVALGLVAGFAGSSRADDKKANATGTWTWTFKTQNGDEISNTLKLKQDGEKLTGNLTAFGSDTDITDGKVEKGDHIAFTVNREFNGNKFTIKYKGKVEGDTIKFTSEFERDGEVRKREFEAKRQTEKA